MDPILIGAIALGVAVVGLIAHGLYFWSTRRISLVVLWVIVPLAGTMIASLMVPPNLVAVGLGGASLVLALLTLVATVALPVVGEQRAPEKAGSRERRDRAA